MNLFQGKRWCSAELIHPQDDFEGATIDEVKSDGSSSLVARAKGKSLPVSTKKMTEILKRVRGLGAKEASIQLHLSRSTNANYAATVIESAIRNALHNHNMNENRLVLHKIWHGKARMIKKMNFMARGRNSIIRKRKSHLWVELIEQPYREDEVRLGRAGRRLQPRSPRRRRVDPAQPVGDEE